MKNIKEEGQSTKPTSFLLRSCSHDQIKMFQKVEQSMQDDITHLSIGPSELKQNAILKKGVVVFCALSCGVIHFDVGTRNHLWTCCNSPTDNFKLLLGFLKLPFVMKQITSWGWV